MTYLAMPSANSWFGIRLLPAVLSLTAGSMDVVGLYGGPSVKRCFWVCYPNSFVRLEKAHSFVAALTFAPARARPVVDC
jgi:hypothetical protein